MHVVEGDARLVEQSSVANWQIGRLEVFFEGSWGQVCAGSFGVADVTVACRSMGFGSGTIGPLVRNLDTPRERFVFPEVAATRVGCTGQEANLLECPGETDVQVYDYYAYNSIGCFGEFGEPLVVACVAAAENGVYLAPTSFCHNLCRSVRGHHLHLPVQSPQHVTDHYKRMPVMIYQHLLLAASIGPPAS